MDERSPLSDIHDGTDRWKILVRVFRRWNVYPKNSPNELFAISFVLIDEQGNTIQASVLNKSLHKKFNDTAKEGRVYFIANFVVTRNVSQYRATTHAFKLTFTPSTHIKEEKDELPQYSYFFMNLADILKIKHQNEANHLIDVIAFVKSIGNLEEYKRDEETKNKLRLVITDNEENDVECVLWDECSSDAYSDYILNEDTPVVIILSLARIGFSEDGLAQVHNSFSATRVSFNLDIKEVKDFIQRHSDGISPIVTQLRQPMPSHYSQQPSASLFSKESRIQISAIREQAIGEHFVINCEIQKLETIHGWSYDGCVKCSAKVKEDNGEFNCPQCKKKPYAIEPKLKLHYTMSDNSGTVSVLFWDRLAVQLVKKTAPQLKFILAERKMEYDIPEELDSVIGKRLLIKLKRNEYNIKYPNSSISVSHFLLCEDLLEQFDNADTDDDYGGGGGGAIKMKEKKGKNHSDEVINADQNSSLELDSNSITLLDDDEEDDEDVPIAMLSRTLNTKATKCRKKNTTKTQAPTEKNAKRIHSPAKPATHTKILKSIKKEKK